MKKELPKIIKKPAAVEIYEYEKAVFETMVSGKPTPTVEWSAGDVRLEPGELVVYEDLGQGAHRLTLREVRKVQAGMVTVRAVNELGDMSASARLKVTGQSKIAGKSKIAGQSNVAGHSKVIGQSKVTG